jgi:hypothetical protein
MSRVVTQWLDVAVAPMERMVVVLEQANRMPAETTEAVRASILRAEAKLLPTLISGLVEQNDLFLAEWAAGATEAGERSEHGTGASASAKRGEIRHLTPVPVTRGSGRIKPGGKVVHRGSL